MKLSVIIPLHNGGEPFDNNLHLLGCSRLVPDEIIVVDDASTDHSQNFASNRGLPVLKIPPPQRGPAFARNRGAAAASGDVLVFLDSDVAVHDDTLWLIEKYLSEQPDWAAVFGSYDDHPAARNFVSLYKNLLHSYTHQSSRSQSGSFWAGCGAIRSAIFKKLNGFDETYNRPTIEDIELGSRLADAGYRVRLCQDILVTHLKKWSLGSLLRTDILQRAIPWSLLIIRKKRIPDDLNVTVKNRWSALTAWMLILASILSVWMKGPGVVALAAFIASIALNVPLYKYFIRHGGLLFTPIGYLLHQFYLLYSSATFVVIWLWEKI